MKKGILITIAFISLFVLFACTGKPSFTFDYMGVQHNLTVDVTDGMITEPTDVMIEDYIFLGWFQEQSFETPFDFSKPIESDDTAYGYFVTEETYVSDILPLNHANNDVYYEIFVRSFADSNQDGIGDLNGITQNLDYLSSLGITAIWLMPIQPSPSYHGYDVTDYYQINSDYGTMADFQNLIDTAASYDMKIIMDLVVNHTSDQHPWYQSAVSSTSSEYRDWYIFAEGSNSGYESFVGGMKDLNYDNPDVDQEMKNIMAFYIEKGVHGFRLDAVTKIFINSDINAALLIKGWENYIKTLNPDAYIISEAWYQSYEDYATYYIGSQSLFNFNLKNEIYAKIGNASSTYLFVRRVVDMYDEFMIYRPDFIDGIIIGNHDMDRIASSAGFNSHDSEEKLKLAASIQLTLPGNPFIYYGEEIAMKGTRVEGETIPDYGVAYDETRRTPFIWGSSTYQTSWFPDDQNEDTISAETQMTQDDSIWHHYQTMIALRRNNPALMYGHTITAYNDNSNAIQGYVRVYEDQYLSQTLLIIHNTSKVEQTVTLTGDYTILYGDLVMPLYSTLIIEIDPENMGDYI